MKRGFGLVGMVLAAGLALSACGRLKDDSTRKDPKLSPAPGGAPAVDTVPAAAPAAPTAESTASLNHPPNPPDTSGIEPAP